MEDPTDLDQEIYAAARALFDPAFEEVRHRGQGVRLLGVGISNIVAAGPADLFEADARTRLRGVTQAVDAVRKKFGFKSLTTAKLLDTRSRDSE